MRTIALLLCMLLLAGGAPLTSGTLMAPTLAPPTFVDATVALGLGGFMNGGHLGEDGQGPMFPELSGPGACWLDADRDGLLDLYLTSGRYTTHPELNAQRDPHSRLYRNTGAGFVEQGGRVDGMNQGCAAADYDNDGWMDLYVTGFGGGALLHNENGVLVDRAPMLGVVDANCPNGPCWGTSASWFDADRDGCLDLYVAHFGDYDLADPAPNSPEFSPPQVDRFFHGACGGPFTDITLAAGLTAQRTTWASLAADLNDDGWTDLYACNDADVNDLYLNDQDGTFTRVTGVLDDPRHCMGTSIADLDGDGHMDVTTSNFVAENNGVFLCTGPTSCDDIGDVEPWNEALSYSAWAATIADLDQDGRADVMFANGLTETGPFKPPAKEPQLLFLQRTPGAFVSARPLVGPDFGVHIAGRGAAWADHDNDGDLDVLVAEAGASPTHLFRADQASGNFLLVDLVGGAGVNRDAVGARVRVVADGIPTQMRDRTAGDGYLSSSDPRLHFGLGHAETATVHVRWPDGATQTFANVAANAAIRLTQGIGAPEVLWTRPLVRIVGPTQALWNETATFEAQAPPGRPAFASATWRFDAISVPGLVAQHAFTELGETYARVTATDTLGRARTQSITVLVWDDLQATLTPEFDVTPLGVPPRALLRVTHSDGTPIAGANVRANLTYSGGEAQDAAVAALPRAARTALGYVPMWVNGTTDANGTMWIDVPENLKAPTGAVPRGAHALGDYRIVVNGEKRDVPFPETLGTVRVGVV